jgi:hypothetical protein
MGSKLAVAALAMFATVPWCPIPLRAQVRPVATPPLLALALNDLDFGSVLPGIPVSVAVSDARHAGLFEVRGPAGASIRVEFVVPGALTASGGALLPLVFGLRDGHADFTRGGPGGGLSFDPHAPVIGSLGPDGTLYLRLGGTALPARTQTGGDYRATIFMTVYDLGS